MNKPSVIAISFAKKALEPNSRDRQRMLEYAAVLEQYHVVVLTKNSDGHESVQREGNLNLYATNAETKIGKLVSAVKIVRSIIKLDNNVSFVVSSQDPFETSLVARLALLFNRRSVHHVQIHGDVFNQRYFKPAFINKLRCLFAKYIVRSATAIRVVSERIKRSLVELEVSASKITVLPIQPELENFLQIGREREYQTTDPLRLLYVGRFAPEKNLQLLIGAVAEAKKAGVDLRLKLLGGGEEKKTLLALVEKLSLSDIVEFSAWTNDVPNAMKEADVLCLSSNHEGYAMVLLEAMAAGLALVTTDVGCVGELVLNEKHGLIVPVGDVAAFIEALINLSGDRDKMIAYGRFGHQTAQEQQKPRSKFLEEIQQSFNLG
jgi:glycosyltransferase involved in cell wall biosynthesis